MTPETFVSPWVESELQAFDVQQRERGETNRIVPVMLVDTPMPPFLPPRQFLRWHELGDQAAFAALLETLDGPSDATLAEPFPPVSSDVPDDLRDALIQALVPIVDERSKRRDLVGSLGIDRKRLDGFRDLPELAANALLVLALGKDDPKSAYMRVIDTLLREFGDESEEPIPELSERLAPLRDRLLAETSADPKRDLLERYRLMVVERHRELVPYFRKGAGASVLDHVFVELELSRDHESWGDELGLDIADDSAGRRQPDALDTLLARHSGQRLWIVKGDPGAGKTTLLRHLARRLADPDRPTALEGVIPIFESLPRLVREREALLDRLERQLSGAKRDGAAGLGARLQAEEASGNLLLLLDALDEVPVEERDEAFDLLRSLVIDFPAARFVVSTRPIGYVSPGREWRELTVQPLDRDRRREFLARWFAPPGAEPDWARADELLPELERHATLRDLSETPLYLTLIAMLIAEKKDPSPNRAKLFEQIFDLLLEGKHGLDADARKLPRQVELLRFLAAIAESWTVDARVGEPLRELEARVLDEPFDKLRKPLEREPNWRTRPGRILEDVARATGILAAHDGEDADWRFWHKSFGEALTANALHARFARGGLSACLEQVAAVAGDPGRWAEPFALLAGKVTDPDGLIVDLVERDPAIGLRALATAESVSPATLARVLELSDDWKQRREVIEGIPEKVAGDPQRAVRLLESIGTQTTDGNDLYFLDATLARLHGKDPELSREIDRVRNQLWSGRPGPEGQAFEVVETRDGPLDVWADVPAGEFTMGPGEKVIGGMSDDAHEVRVPTFRIWRTPVTIAQYRVFDRLYRENETVEETHPATELSWFEAASFCRWLGARLPSEAEWEYACRAGTTTAYSSGDNEDDLSRVGWWDGNSEDRLHSVGEKEANPFGLYDLHGNVWEWCQDDWSDTYAESASVHPAAFESEESGSRLRVVRGGCFWAGASYARSACRLGDRPGGRIGYLGFRPALTP